MCTDANLYACRNDTCFVMVSNKHYLLDIAIDIVRNKPKPKVM